MVVLMNLRRYFFPKRHRWCWTSYDCLVISCRLDIFPINTAYTDRTYPLKDETVREPELPDSIFPPFPDILHTVSAGIPQAPAAPRLSRTASSSA